MEQYIGRNLSTLVKAKNLADIDIIVVNDGSKDNTLAIACEYEKEYGNSVRIIDKPNGHYGTCINEGLKIAQGKYFRILDADDWFETEHLDQFVEKLRTCDADLVVTLRVEVSKGKDGQLQKTYYPIENIEYDKIYDAKSFDIESYSKHVEFNMHSMTYKTEILRSIGLQLPGGVCYTDMIYCLLPMDRINTLTVFDIYLYNYVNDREGSSTDAASIRRNFAHIKTVMREMTGCLVNHPSENPIVHKNQMRYVKEAFGFLMMSMLKQGYVSKSDYEDLAIIIKSLKKLNFDDRMLHKYYLRKWWKQETCNSLNFCLWLFKVTHPFKNFS